MHRRVDDVAAAPVVSDEINGIVDALQLVLEPVAVRDRGSRKMLGQWSAESWRRQPHDVITAEGVDQGTPQGLGLRITMHQNDCHGTGTVLSDRFDRRRRRRKFAAATRHMNSGWARRAGL